MMLCWRRDADWRLRGIVLPYYGFKVSERWGSCEYLEDLRPHTLLACYPLQLILCAEFELLDRNLMTCGWELLLHSCSLMQTRGRFCEPTHHLHVAQYCQTFSLLPLCIPSSHRPRALNFVPLSVRCSLQLLCRSWQMPRRNEWVCSLIQRCDAAVSRKMCDWKAVFLLCYAKK